MGLSALSTRPTKSLPLGNGARHGPVALCRGFLNVFTMAFARSLAGPLGAGTLSAEAAAHASPIRLSDEGKGSGTSPDDAAQPPLENLTTDNRITAAYFRLTQALCAIRASRNPQWLDAYAAAARCECILLKRKAFVSSKTAGRTPGRGGRSFTISLERATILPSMIPACAANSNLGLAVESRLR
jgi:hypothetical protein